MSESLSKGELHRVCKFQNRSTIAPQTVAMIIALPKHVKRHHFSIDILSTEKTNFEVSECQRQPKVLQISGKAFLGTVTSPLRTPILKLANAKSPAQ